LNEAASLRWVSALLVNFKLGWTGLPRTNKLMVQTTKSFVTTVVVRVCVS